MSDDPRSDLRTAVDQFGAALGEAFKQGMRQAITKQIADDYGPGPWLLHPDGSVDIPATITGPDRILWNKRDGDIDEIVVYNATVHVEQMDNRCWWIGIDLPSGAHWAGNFHCDSRGRMTFTEQENIDLVWDDDDSHDDPPQPADSPL